MKKILVCILCLIFAFTLTVSVFADEVGAPTESAIVSPAEPAEDTTGDSSEGGVTTLLSEKFERWVVPHLEEIAVIVTLIVTAFYNKIKHKLLNKSIGTMNNNTITIAEQSSNMMNQALTGMENVSNIVTAYDARIAALLEAHKATAEDKERLEKELSEMKAYLQKSAESNIEFANELAELLSLANIPNYKKEEIGARHMAAVRSIKAAETEALNTVQGVIHNDGGEEA